MDIYRRRMLVPHRLMPYPEPVLTHFHKRNGSTIINFNQTDDVLYGTSAAFPSDTATDTDTDTDTDAASSSKSSSSFTVLAQNKNNQKGKGSNNRNNNDNNNGITTSNYAENEGPLGWEKMTCCIPRQNCWDRKSWISVKDTDVAIVNIYGLYTPLGNSNFHSEHYRHCSISVDGKDDICP